MFFNEDLKQRIKNLEIEKAGLEITRGRQLNKIKQLQQRCEMVEEQNNKLTHFILTMLKMENQYAQKFDIPFRIHSNTMDCYSNGGNCIVETVQIPAITISHMRGVKDPSIQDIIRGCE